MHLNEFTLRLRNPELFQKNKRKKGGVFINMHNTHCTRSLPTKTKEYEGWSVREKKSVNEVPS